MIYFQAQISFMEKKFYDSELRYIIYLFMNVFTQDSLDCELLSTLVLPFMWNTYKGPVELAVISTTKHLTGDRP